MSGLVAGIIGSRIFFWQWSQLSAHPPAVMEKAGNEFFPHPDISELSNSLKVGVEKRMSRPNIPGALARISATRSASNCASSKATLYPIIWPNEQPRPKGRGIKLFFI